MDKIEFLDLKHYYLDNKSEYEKIFYNVMSKGRYILGEEVELFEKEFSQYLGAKYVTGVGNGLDAIVIALKSLGVGPGDEVLVPAHTFIATWLAVSSVGAIPVAVDVDSTTMNIDVTKIQSAITTKTKAIIGVHLYGRPCEVGALLDLCKKNNLYFIEDAAQAHGATYGHQKVGSVGDAGCFSFYPGKNLGAIGDGGAISTNSPLIFEKFNLLRNYGSKIKYQHEVIGTNSRLDEIQASFLRFRLKKLDSENNYRNQLASIYLDRLKGLEELILPATIEIGQQVWHLFVIRTSRRNDLQRHLAENGVQTLIHYPVPSHLSECYSHLKYKNGDFPVAESISNTALSLPMGPHLSLDDVNAVSKNILKFFKK
jgi:dTDP-4-amino-4,6-dideoxygalactose transaminase